MEVLPVSDAEISGLKTLLNIPVREIWRRNVWQYGCYFVARMFVSIDKLEWDRDMEVRLHCNVEEYSLNNVKRRGGGGGTFTPKSQNWGYFIGHSLSDNLLFLFLLLFVCLSIFFIIFNRYWTIISCSLLIIKASHFVCHLFYHLHYSKTISNLCTSQIYRFESFNPLVITIWNDMKTRRIIFQLFFLKLLKIFCPWVLHQFFASFIRQPFTS